MLPRRRVWRLAGPTLLLVLLALPGGSLLPPSPGRPAPSSGIGTASAVPTVMLGDGQTAQTNWNGSNVVAQDVIGPAGGNLSVRRYAIEVSTTSPVPGVRLHLYTTPMLHWGLPNQLPTGLENLPSLPYWSWNVTELGGGPAVNWSANVTSGTLWAVVPWANATFQVVGTAAPTVSVEVVPGTRLPTNVTSLGLSLHDPTINGSSLLTYADYPSLAGPLDPSVIRFGLSAVAGWDSDTGTPVFNFTMFDAASRLAEKLHAASYLNLPAGNWGDGNLLPPGMPLDVSLALGYQGSVGYFPVQSAYVAYVLAVVNHTITASEPVKYWNIGNEVPLVNQSVVNEYIRLFNAAASAIHSKLPGALVGSDVMLNRTYFASFTSKAKGVGFLSFHYYPSTGLCIQNGSYCPPAGGTNGTQDPALFRPVSDFDTLNFYGPSAAASAWANATGNRLPVLDSETNLAGIGGSTATAWMGTDPRQQMLDGATWLLATLVRATNENLSALTYFALTGPSEPSNSTTWAYGGWGFGLAVPSLPGLPPTFYAPWWALDLWAGVVGGSQVGVTSADTSVVQSVASISKTDVRVLLVNRVDTPTTVAVSGVANGTGTSTVSVLDNRSYVESFVPHLHHEVLESSGLTVSLHNSSAPRVTIDGYGAALVVIPVAPANNSTGGTGGNGSGGNGTGGNSSGGHGTGGGNGTGSSGNATSGGGSSPPPSSPDPSRVGVVPRSTSPHGSRFSGTSGSASSSASSGLGSDPTAWGGVSASVVAALSLLGLGTGVAFSGARAGGPDGVRLAHAPRRRPARRPGSPASRTPVRPRSGTAGSRSGLPPRSRS